MVDKSDYFAKYYKEHRPAILAKRRLRYKNDPEYRAKMQKKARDRARQKIGARRTETIANIQQKATDLKNQTIDLDSLGSQKVKRWPVGEFVTASVMAEALGVSLATLGNWVKSGIVPSPTVSSTAGKHLFSVEYLDLVRTCRIDVLAAGGANDDFRKLVTEKYKTIQGNEEFMRRGGLDE